MANRRTSPRRSFSLRDRYRSVVDSTTYRNSGRFIRRKPVTSFLIALGILLLIMILGQIVGTLNRKETKQPVITKEVKTFTIGKAPRIDLQAQIESNGVVQIVAQAPGIVQDIKVRDGESINRGETIVSLSSNYQGGNAPALQAQLAGAQLRNTNETYDLQRGIIFQQRNVATASAENTEQLRQISDRSLGETRDLLSTNEDLLTALQDQIAVLEALNPADPTIQQLRGQQVQLQAGINQLRSTVRSLEYSTNTQNPPTVLANAQKEIALKQLDVQEKALELGREAARIQYNLAQVQVGTMNPASPFNGTVQRVNIKVGQAVNPGTVIATVSCNNVNSTAVIRVPQDVAERISRVEPTVITTNGMDISVMPSYVSTVATDGQLYTILYNLPEGTTADLTDGQYLNASVPIGSSDTNSVIPFIPIDSVYTSQNESTVFVIKNNKAVARKVEVGQVYGDFVAITGGLENGDRVILNRNVIAGDTVRISGQNATKPGNKTINEIKY